MRSATPLMLRSAGIDLADVHRLRLAVTRSGESFAKRILNVEEQARSNIASAADVGELAALFSIKESVVKAMGGLPRGAAYTDVVVGAPEPALGGNRRVRLAGEFAARADLHDIEVLARSAQVRERLVLSWALAVSRGSR